MYKHFIVTLYTVNIFQKIVPGFFYFLLYFIVVWSERKMYSPKYSSHSLISFQALPWHYNFLTYN